MSLSSENKKCFSELPNTFCQTGWLFEVTNTQPCHLKFYFHILYLKFMSRGGRCQHWRCCRTRIWYTGMAGFDVSFPSPLEVCSHFCFCLSWFIIIYSYNIFLYDHDRAKRENREVFYWISEVTCICFGFDLLCHVPSKQLTPFS